MEAGGFFAVYVVGVIVIWVWTWITAQDEPTAHGQDILLPMGCALGLLWPLFVVYLIVASPLIALSWYRNRGER